jgi:hypothetical protein
LNINTQELQPSLIIKKKQQKTNKYKQKTKNKNKTKKTTMKYTSARQFALCQMTNRQELYNN